MASTIHMRKQLENKAARVFQDLGLSMEQAIELFLRRVSEERDVSFLHPGEQEERIHELEDKVDGLLAELSKRESSGKPTVSFDELCQQLGL